MLLEVEPVLKSSRASRAMNALDRLLALLLGATAPVIIGSAAAIAVLSRGSPLIVDLHVGRDGMSFWIWRL